MDPITVGLLAFTELLKFLGKMSDGQTLEQKKQIWDWFIKDMGAWRKFFHIDEVK